MKHFFVFLLLLGCLNYLSAQNLVVNPSFENTSNGCSGFPIAAEGMSNLLNWDNVSNNAPGDTCSTPDLFSTCNAGLLGVTGVPSNALGYQCPKTGEKYGGVITYDMTGSYREYMQGQLSSPLQAGQTYCVSMFVSLADGVPYATNNIGVHFANTHQTWNAPCYGPFSPVNLTPQLNYTCVLTDTVWVRLQWDYVATGGEQYMIIGNFYNNGATTTANTGQPAFPNPFGYYFLDDISVTAGSCCYTEIRLPGVTDCDMWEISQSGGSSALASFCISDPPTNFTQLTSVNGSTCAPIPPLAGTWSGPGITNPSTGAFSPSVAGPGTHTITFTASCGYVATANIIVSPCAMQACVETNGSITVSGGAAPYTWQNQTTAQDCSSCFVGCAIPPGCAVNVLQWTNFATGTNIPAPSGYPIRVTDAGGNTITINDASSLAPCGADPCASTTITINVVPTHATCTTAGSAVATASGGAAPYTYSWNTTPVQNTATATNLPAGTYTVTATDANGCTGTQSVTINPAAQAPTVTVSSTNAGCGGVLGTATATVSGGTTPYTYSWNTTPTQTTATATGLLAGNYTVTVTDGNGCTATGNATVNPPAQGPSVSTSSTNAGCGGATGTATASVSGGTTPYTYSWNTTPVQTTATATNLASGNYTVTVTDGNGCAATSTVNVGQTSGLSLSISGTDALCNGQASGTATVVASGGTAPYTYSWNSAPVQTTATATNLPAGNYTVQVSDASGCTGQQSIQINEPAAATLSLSSTQTQCLVNSGTATVTVSGGQSPYSYSWNTTPVQTNATASNLAAGNYTVTVTDANTCQVTGSVIVSAANAPTVSITTSQDVSCFGETDGAATVSASGGTPGYTYSWSPSGGTAATATDLAPGTYNVTVVDNAGCTNVAQVIINEPDALVVSETIVNANCGAQDGEITLTVSGGNGSYTYNWNPAVSTTNVATGLPIGLYNVTVTDPLGCSASVSVTIVTATTFDLDAYPEITSVEVGGSVGLTLDIETGIVVDTIIWTPADGLSCTDCEDPVASPTETTVYYVTVIDDAGCIAMDSVVIVVQDPCGELFVPTIFSPNEDGLNDLECVMGSCVTSVDFTIYDRWGEVVFATTDKNNCWDGNFRGKPAQTGVYVYKLRATLSSGEIVTQSGNVNLTR